MTDGDEDHHDNGQQEGNQLTDLEVPQCFIEQKSDDGYAERQNSGADVEIVIELCEEVADEQGQSAWLVEIA